MQTVDHSSSPSITPPPSERKPDLRSMREVRVRPVVPRRYTVPTRETLQIDEDGGEAEAHPS